MFAYVGCGWRGVGRPAAGFDYIQCMRKNELGEIFPHWCDGPCGAERGFGFDRTGFVSDSSKTDVDREFLETFHATL